MLHSCLKKRCLPSLSLRIKTILEISYICFCRVLKVPKLKVSSITIKYPYDECVTLTYGQGTLVLNAGQQLIQVILKPFNAKENKSPDTNMCTE